MQYQKAMVLSCGIACMRITGCQQESQFICCRNSSIKNAHPECFGCCTLLQKNIPPKSSRGQRRHCKGSADERICNTKAVGKFKQAMQQERKLTSGRRLWYIPLYSLSKIFVRDAGPDEHNRRQHETLHRLFGLIFPIAEKRRCRLFHQALSFCCKEGF